MSWIIFTISGAFFQNLRSSLQKKLNKDLSIVASTYVRFAFALPFAILIFFLNFGNFEIISKILKQTDFIYLTTKESGIKSVNLYDNLGRLIYTNKKDRFSYSIETTNLKSGIYFLSLNISDDVVRKKIIIE